MKTGDVCHFAINSLFLPLAPRGCDMWYGALTRKQAKSRGGRQRKFFFFASPLGEVSFYLYQTQTQNQNLPFLPFNL